MIPLCVGVSWQVVLCGLLQLVASADIIALFMYYSFTGLYLHDPWNKCPRTWYNITPIPKPIRCYTVLEFRNLTKYYIYNGTDRSKSFYSGYNSYYFGSNITYFSASPLIYFVESWVKLNVRQYFSIEFVVFFFLIWTIAALFYKQLYKKYIWRLILISDHIINGIYIGTFLYICYYFMELPVTSDYIRYHEYEQNAMDIVKVDPGRDSAVMTFSNSLMYIFKGLVQYKLRYYIESAFKSNVGMAILHPYPIFYMWPFFFSNLLGPFFARLFYSLNFILEFTTFIITYQVLVEVMVSEWKWVKRWLVTAFISAAGLIMSLVLPYNTKTYLYIFTTAITSLTEAVVVCWLYPGLTDDIHFHNGNEVTTWRKWSLKMLPSYYVYKIYLSFGSLVVKNAKVLARSRKTVNNSPEATSWAWLVGILPLPVGALFAILYHVIIKGQDWKKLVKPCANWGPDDDVTCQLRKQFESRQYVSSQSPRYLSRHIISKSQTPSYRLNVRYFDTERSSTVFTDRYRQEADRKEIVN